MQKKSDGDALFLPADDVKNVLTDSLKQEIDADTSFHTSAGFLQSSLAMDLAYVPSGASGHYYCAGSIQLALHSALKTLWRNIITVCWKS